MTIKLYDLPKISMNEYFARSHWTKRNKMNKDYKLLVRSQTKIKIDYPCEVTYTFYFTKNPLDCSNCSAMVKMIEDSLFANDSINVVQSIKIISLKSNHEYVRVVVDKI